ncbi:Aste57867_10106 [Aphanomyces stellatus]|uniref:Aste57867_10106 protein n=1 Tax=Aphanomyces stellatus TaxID=120398 RepID=A0A485KQG9_9STRA|nr:hypothetical protein As57867_010067 [Aphanomyces stellatus]VFT86982.1 Aste57867_10106 [Aphanomyces stellatus]
MSLRRPGMTRGKTMVTVHVYDIIESNVYTYAWGLGAFHSGVVVGGIEYSFAGGAGIFTSPPKEAQGAVFREAIDIGYFEGTSQEARRILDDMRGDFHGTMYNLLTKSVAMLPSPSVDGLCRNCNTFSNEACLRLVGQPIPPYINRIAYFGSCFSCLIPKQLTGDAPVQGGSSTTTFTGFSKGGASSSYGSTAAVPVFAGDGLSLNSNRSSSDATPSSSLMESSADDEAVRRQKRVAAALKRLEKANEPSD